MEGRSGLVELYIIGNYDIRVLFLDEMKVIGNAEGYLSM